MTGLDYGTLKDALAMGANGALIFVCVALWRFDRRLLTVELALAHILKQKEGA